MNQLSQAPDSTRACIRRPNDFGREPFAWQPAFRLPRAKTPVTAVGNLITLKTRVRLESFRAHGLLVTRLPGSAGFRPRGVEGTPLSTRARCLLTGCFSGCQGKPTGSLNTLIKIMFWILFVPWQYAASQQKFRTPSRKIHDPSRKKTLRSPVRHLRQNRQRPRPVRGRVRRARAEPAGLPSQVRRPLEDLGAGPVSPNGTKTSLGLGSYPVVTLAMARERALANARAIAEGRDPRRRMRQIPTFAKANETVSAIHAKHWKSERTEGQWHASMRVNPNAVLHRTVGEALAAGCSLCVQRSQWPVSPEFRLRPSLSVGLVDPTARSTERQGQYLAFIHACTKVNGRPPRPTCSESLPSPS